MVSKLKWDFFHSEHELPMLKNANTKKCKIKMTVKGWHHISLLKEAYGVRNSGLPLLAPF